jgi:hypothetical protein
MCILKANIIIMIITTIVFIIVTIMIISLLLPISIGARVWDPERAKTSSEEDNEITRAFKRYREIESRRFESLRVREFELDSSVIPTVKSEANKRERKLSG